MPASILAIKLISEIISYSLAKLVKWNLVAAKRFSTCLTYQQIVGCRWLLLVLEHGIVMGGVTPHNAAAAAVAATVVAPATCSSCVVAAIAGQGQQGDGLALLLLLVVEVQQRVEWQRQT